MKPEVSDLIEYIEPKMVPLGPEDILPSFRFKLKFWKFAWTSAMPCNQEAAVFNVPCNAVKYEEIQNEYLVDRNDGKGWVACEKQARE